jgi:hypothetical protein
VVLVRGNRNLEQGYLYVKKIDWILPWRARKTIKRQAETIKALELWIRSRHPLELAIPELPEPLPTKPVVKKDDAPKSVKK